MNRSVLFAIAALSAGLPFLLAAQSSPRRSVPFGPRPNPQATIISGSSTGPVLDVTNNYPGSPLDVFGVLGAVTGGPLGIGVVGWGANPGSGNIGVVGLDSGPGGYGTVGVSSYNPGGNPASSNQATGALGKSGFGSGVVGLTEANSGASGPTEAGVAGVDDTNDGGLNDGVLGTTTSGAFGVEGESSDGSGGGVYGGASNGNGVTGHSQSGIGVEASSLGINAALFASTMNQGLADAIDAAGFGGFGVYASSATFPGVYGTSASSDGVDGYTAAAGNNGVAGTSTQPNDTCAPQCVGGDGLFGLSDASNDGSGNIEGGVEGNGYYSLLGVPYDSTSYSFAGTDQTGAVQILIDASGNILTKGSLGVLGVISNISRTVHGYYAKSYGTQAMSHILEDENTSGITNGVGLVHIDPAFTESVGSANYQVFLTPNGDCNGLYVAEKTATSFVVRELRGGRSTLSFDYRIVGHLYGQGAQRMTVFASTGGLGQGAALLGTGHSQKRAIMLAKVKIEQRHVGAAAARSAATLSRQAKSTFATKRRFVLPSVDFSLLGRR